MGQDAIAHQASIHEKELIAAASEAQSAGDESTGPNGPHLALDLGEVSIGFAADDLQDALSR
jgi:hypothetical protein